jgi:two-component system response regulator AtoC
LDATYEVDGAELCTRLVGQVSLLFTWATEARAITLREGQTLVVGRAPPAELVISDRSISRLHARVTLAAGVVMLEDLGSTNGCVVNGSRVDRAHVRDQDVVQLGEIEMRVCGRVNLSVPPNELSHAELMRAVHQELTRARLTARDVSVLAWRQSEPDTLCATVRAALPPLARLCVFAPGILLVVFPEQDSLAVRSWLQSAPFPGKENRHLGLANYPSLTCNAQELVAYALDACHAVRAGQLEEVARSTPATVEAPIVLSTAMLRLYDLVAKAARTTLPVLVHGETGTGKELIARALHDKSPRKSGPFKALNCATIPASLLESVLFGHERGAFTGADRQAPGVFEQAQGGTVFLDEVGELSPLAQAALLRVLEQRRVVRVGGTKEIEVDARVVAATHRNLATMVQLGTFREDLMFRLDALTLRIPPLRERSEEVLPLADVFLAAARDKWSAGARGFSDDVVQTLRSYAWPGNIRQLKNVVERAAVVCGTETVEVEDLPPELWEEAGEISPVADAPSGENSPVPVLSNHDHRPLPQRVREFETTLIRQALAEAGGNQAQAARLLGVPRRTLTSKMQIYGMWADRWAQRSPSSLKEQTGL